MAVYRGHAPRHGATESQWRRMTRAAKAARMDRDIDEDRPQGVRDILESLLRKGFEPEWIIARLKEKKESRDAYLHPTNRRLRAEGIKHAGKDPGSQRYHEGKLTRADIELYYYH